MRTTSSLPANEATASFAFLTSGPILYPDPAPEDQDTGDVPTGVDEDALNQDDLDTDRITSPEDQAVGWHNCPTSNPAQVQPSACASTNTCQMDFSAGNPKQHPAPAPHLTSP